MEENECQADAFCFSQGGTLISYGPSRKYERSSTGTTVTVKDLFYNVSWGLALLPSLSGLCQDACANDLVNPLQIPVRRSQILLSTPFTSDMSDNEKAASAAELSACRKVIETIALAFPEVSFTLNLETQGGPSEPSGRQMKRILTVQKTDSSVKTFQALFGKTLIKGVKEIHLWADDVRIDGFVSFVGHTTKAHQYLYVNNFPLKNRELQRTIEKRFQRTNFGRDDDASGGRMAGRGSPRNVMYLKPVYVLKVQLETRRLDLGMGPRKREIGFEVCYCCPSHRRFPFTIQPISDLFSRDRTMNISVESWQQSSMTPWLPKASSRNPGESHLRKPHHPAIPAALIPDQQH